MSKPNTVDPIAFFLEHAGYSYNPATETQEQGRQRCAETLAAAEARARSAGCVFHWSRDSIDSSDFCDDPALWQCIAFDPDGHVFASLGGVDFGRDAEPWDSPYRRVVEAELATEYKP